ncbi:MAG TPA: homogentisate 1,2-dioxygenase [Actinomycetes bacterium]|nr:homogentisate 1,2-dioxygenase [Actinomycetes bacterium]
MYYRSAGQIPRKRHVQFRQPDGSLYAEELMGQEGFSSDASLLYHRHLPTAIIAAQSVERPPDGLVPNAPLLPRHVRTHQLDTGGDLVEGRRLLLANDDVRISYVAADAASTLYRNAAGDELVYLESGSATLESVFGRIGATAGDYVYVPCGTTHRWLPAAGAGGDGQGAGEPTRALVIEARGHITPPGKYLSERGQFLEHAPYCERDIRGPEGPLTVDDDGPADVLVRHRAGLTRYTYQHHPFDVVGWDGCQYPYALSIHDFEPITGSLHQPPPVHQTFAGPRFVVCSFVPRLFDYHPDAIPVPYNHHNVDSDELLFYCGGDFMSRAGSGIELGSMSLHPNGFTHGPQPGSVERALGAKGTDELAVMVDTFRPLALGPEAIAAEDAEYAWTWAGGRRQPSKV